MLHRTSVFFLSLIFIASVSADTLKLAVASNFTATATVLAKIFEKHHQHKVLISSASTGTLYTQIFYGANYDIFLAADSLRPQLLQQQHLGSHLITYAYGQLALVVQPHIINNIANHRTTSLPLTFDAIRDIFQNPLLKHLSIAKPKLAPYGRASRELLVQLDLWDSLQSQLIYGNNIAQTLLHFHSANADTALVAYAQVLKLEPRPLHIVIPEKFHSAIQQQAILLNSDSTSAQDFMQFLSGDIAKNIIRQQGYRL